MIPATSELKYDAQANINKSKGEEQNVVAWHEQQYQPPGIFYGRCAEFYW